MSSWISTKKRGRDDEQIEHDRSTAIEARKNKKKSITKQRKAALSSSSSRAKNLKKKAAVMDSLASFIVNNDSDDEKSWNDDNDNSSSDEQEMKDHILENDDDDDSSTDDDDGKNDSFFKKYTKRTSKAPSKVTQIKKTLAKKTMEFDDDLDDSSSDEEERHRARKKLATAAKNKGKTKTLRTIKTKDVINLDSDSDDSALLNCKPFAKKKDNTQNNNENDNVKRSTSDNNKSTKAAATTVSKLFQPKTKTETKTEDLVDTPDTSSKKKKKAVNKKATKKKIELSPLDYCSDPDEAMAIAEAIRASEEEEAVRSSSNKVSASSSPLAEELLDESDEGDDNDIDQDDYIDEDAKAASSILATANELSAQVLQTMMQWGATDGMIVDGALALTAAAANNNDNNAAGNSASNHTWISQETMQKILPNVTLAEYQLIGINWMALLHSMKCVVEGKNTFTNVNGVLADEMGLGKTCQTIAFLSWLKHARMKSSNSSGASKENAMVIDDSDGDDDEAVDIRAEETYPHLVIAPSSVLSNWEREFTNFAPHLQVVKYHGSMAERQEMQRELYQHLPGKTRTSGPALDVILAPITYFQKEKSDDRSFLRKFKYDYLVVDEAHLLKNAKGLRYKSLDKFNTMHRLLLTGTPVQNSPKELMSLLCFLMPLFSRKNGDDFDSSDGHDGGESMLQHFVSMQNDGSLSDDQSAYRKLKQLFAPFVLRRRKVDVLSQIMPPKERKVEFVQLDETARKRYNSIISDHVEAKKKGTSAINDHLFTQLRKAAHHPLMLRSRYTSEAEKEHLTHFFHQYGAFRGEGCTKAKVAEEVEKFNDFDIHLTALELIEENQLRRKELERYVLDESDLFSSAKFVRLRSLLPELINDGHRVLIFSVWTTCLDLLSCLLEQMGLKYLRMDGQTAVDERQGLIDEYNRDTTISVFLLSTKACGLGINLTAADTCIMHDLDFNPFNDLQAEDRCHRIGQKKTVTIYKMVSKDTVDEDIYEMQQRKAKMNAAIMDNNEWNKNSSNDKKDVLQTALNRFLKSPKLPAKNVSREKENFVNGDCDSI